ncbi:acid protease [Lepidopterella palustris CBS 459.81]|uniref:Acid protease n=1 Tax=Lepidopterella palustris CBS 459.81 TaxID=1314670 RepID=A0A8E2JIG4_9PEZI|nr:acid protease [Lepidopterella palustris CBS 459.81]
MLCFRDKQFSFVGILSTVFATLVSLCLTESLEQRSTVIPAPISVTPDQNWDGIDGQWSTFTLRIGTPQQFVRTLISTASQQTWVVLAEACGSDNGTHNQNCIDTRGWVFNVSQSSSWHDIGYYLLWTERNMGYDGTGEFGYDTVGLGGLGNEGPTLKNTTVGAYLTTDFYVGMFGVNPKSTNFTTFNDPSPSYMTYLWENKMLPSLSFGYTAGAQYRFTKVLGSLTLGGYDTSRFISNNMTFGFAPDNERDIVVGLQDISMTDETKSNIKLLPTPVTMYIDSTVAEIWLPLDACEAFEAAFGLTYDNTTDLYLVDTILHNQLLAEAANITFTLGAKTSGGQTIEIVLPYSAFDLTAIPPYRNLHNSTNYFPLRRSANETQYVFGRTFLQEAYLVVDWERQNFSVYQCDWIFGAEPHLVPIISPTLMNATNTTTLTQQSSPSVHLTTGAIIGIAVGTGVGVGLIAFGVVWWFWRKRQMAAAQANLEAAAATAKENSSEKSEDETPTAPNSPPANESKVFPKAELPAEPVTRHEMCGGRLLKPEDSGPLGTPTSPSSSGMPSPGLPSPTAEAEASERKVYEMLGDLPPRVEADSRQLSEKESMVVRERRYNGVDNSPTPTPLVDEAPRRPAPVSASEIAVVNSRGLHNVSPVTPRGPRTPRDGRDLESDDAIYSPLSPMDDSSEDSTSRRRFSYE